MRIYITRSSVSMGDDCGAPHESCIEYALGERLSDFVIKIADYLPAMRDSVWSIRIDRKVVCYLDFNSDGKYSYELVIPNKKVSEFSGKIHCHYYYGTGSFQLNRIKDGEFVFDEKLCELLQKCGTLLEQVKTYEEYNGKMK